MSTEDDEASLAAYQSALLDALSRTKDPEAALTSLRSDARVTPYLRDVAEFEPRAVEVGIDLVRQWTLRTDDDGVGVVNDRSSPVASSSEDVAPAVGRRAVLRERGATLAVGPMRKPRPGPGQVLIEILASGVCGTDLHVQDGTFPTPLPLSLGHEAVGIVREVGSGVRLAVGTTVGAQWIQRGCGTCRACLAHRSLDCRAPITWLQNGGGHATWMIAEETGCHVVPSELDPALAAPLFCAGHTAIGAYRTATPTPGDVVAVLGLGGIGHLALQIARAYGHPVIAITGSEDKASDARALGATEVLVGREGLGKRLRDAGGADVIIATTDAMRAVADVVSGLRPGGRLVTTGLGDGPLAIDPWRLMATRTAVLGGRPGPPSQVAELLALAAEGRVKPRVETYPLGRVNQALKRLEEGRVRYRAVLALRS